MQFHLEQAELDYLADAVAAKVLTALHGNRTTEPEPFLNERQAAERLNLPWYSLRSLRLAGRIRHTKGPRNRPLYTASMLREFQQQQQHDTDNNESREALKNGRRKKTA